MERMGKISVEAELSLHPGGPGDLVLDIVDAPPYPTREFCQQWCAEQDDILFRYSPRMAVILVLGVITTVCLLEAFSGLGVAPVGPREAPSAASTAGVPAGRMVAGEGLGDLPPYQPVKPAPSMPLPVMQRSSPMAGTTPQ